MNKIYLIFSLLLTFCLNIHAQCSPNVISFFDDYLLKSKQISNTKDGKLMSQLLQERAPSNFLNDSIKRHPECHREYYSLCKYYFKTLESDDDISRLLVAITDKQLKKEIGVDLCNAFTNDYIEDIPIYNLLEYYFGVEDLGKEEQGKIIERMKVDVYADYWEKIAAAFITDKKDIDYIRERHKSDIELVFGKKPYILNGGLKT